MRPLPRRAVVLTIDDGYEDNLEIARPILQRRSLPATIFLVSRLLGRSNEWSDGGPTAERPLFSAEQARQAQGNGLDFGAHTRYHRRLPVVLTGEIPDPSRIPSGCRFHPRCPALADGTAERAGIAQACRTAPLEVLPAMGEHRAACHLDRVLSATPR